MKNLALVCSLLALVACDIGYQEKKSRIPDVQFVVDLREIGPTNFMAIAEDYADQPGMTKSGPHERPGKTETEYVLSVFGQEDFQIVFNSSDGLGYIFIYCSPNASLSDATEQLQGAATMLYKAYDSKAEVDHVKVMRLSGLSWEEVGKPLEHASESMFLCENREKE